MELKDLDPGEIPLDDIPEMAALPNDRQRNFVVFYVATGIAKEAARKAGYAEKTAAQNGFLLSKQPKIKEAVKAVREWFFSRYVLTKSEALYILSREARNADASKDRRGAVDSLAKIAGWIGNETTLKTDKVVIKMGFDCESN